MRIETLSWSDASPELLTGCGELWHRVWPSEDGVEASAARRADKYAALKGHQVHIGIDDTDGELTVVSVARTFEHTVSLGDTALPVIALASVCSDPDRRGEGWGDAVARAALERTHAALPALFQTGVPAFYERLGSRLITNDVSTSTPGAEAFEDPYVMIHPGDGIWNDTAPVDLLSPGW